MKREDTLVAGPIAIENRLRHALALCVLLAVVLTAGVAFASEPGNGEFTGAEGPVIGAASGTISTDSDVDYFFFYVSTLSDVRVRFSGAYCSLFRSYAAALLDYYSPGQSLSYGSSIDKTWQLPAGLYYAKVTGSSGKSYTLNVTGTGLSATPPSISATQRPATVMTEIYETSYGKAQTIAPYAVNRGEISAQSDVDWYKFYVTWTSDVHLGWDFVNSNAVNTFLLYRGKPVDSLIYSRHIDHELLQLHPGVYYIQISGLVHPYWFSVHGTRVTNHPYASVGVPVAPSRVKHGALFRVTGTISPKHTAGSKGTVLKFYRYQSGHWVLRKTVTTTCSDASATASEYRASVRLPSTGKWRVRAYHRDAGHLGHYSKYDYLTAK